MQMVPIISEVYNRSINLLTGRKVSGGRCAGARHGSPRGGGFPSHQHRRPDHRRRSTLPRRTHSLTAGRTPTSDKCILLAYHLYAWGSALFLSFATATRALLAALLRRKLDCRSLITYERLAIDYYRGKFDGNGARTTPPPVSRSPIVKRRFGNRSWSCRFASRAFEEWHEGSWNFRAK